MATWRDISMENEHAARELLALRRCRSSASRAYYSVYARLTHQLLRQGLQTHARGRSNPAHDALPRLVTRTLKRIGPDDRRRLRKSLIRLYELRVSSDYFPGHTVDQLAARTAYGEMTKALTILERIGGGR